MKKDRSNQSSTSNGDLSLPRKKILRGRKNFQRLFERDAHIVRGRVLVLRHQIVNKTASGCLMGFIVKKSLGKAHKRNRMKRLLREAYRRHQHILTDPLNNVQKTLHGVLMARQIDATYTDVESDVKKVLTQLRDQLPTIS